MKKAGRGIELLPRWILYGSLVFIALFMFTQDANAAVTGKIAGIVMDARTGEPLPGANVIIEGTDRGAACDMDGYYFILRLEPGDYNVQARMMGYKTLTLTGVKVTSGHTTPLDFELETTVIRGEGVTVQAQREIIKIDLSSSSITADKADIEAVPLISGVSQYLNLQAGIDGWSVRGSGLEDTKLMADGLLLVDQRINEPILMPNISEIKEVSLIKGGLNAEYANVRAGVINVITREGSPEKYEGSFEFRFAPYYQKHNGPSIFDPDNYYNEIYFRNKIDTGVEWNVDFFTEDTLGLDTVVRLDSVCWYGPKKVWGDPTSPFYDTVKWKDCYAPNWGGYISDAAGKPITPEGLRDLLLWRRRIDPRGDTLYRHYLGTPDSLFYLESRLPRPDSLFSIYSNDSMYVPIWDITVEDGDTVYDLTGFTRAPYAIPEDEPRIGSYGDNPDWTLDAGFGGPVPILSQYLGDMTFYTSYRDHNDAFPLPDSREYYRERQVSLKLTSRFYNGNIKISAMGRYGITNSLAPWARGEHVGSSTVADIGQVYLRNAFDMISSVGTWNGIAHGSDKLMSRNIADVWNLYSLTPFDVYSSMYGLTVQHALSENTFYDVKLTYVKSNNEANYYYDVPRRMNDTVLIWFGEMFDAEENYITDRSYLADYTGDNIPYGFPDPDFEIVRIVGTDLTVWGPAHMLGTFNHSSSQTYNARVDFTSQINKYNEIKTGLEINYDRIYELYLTNEGMSGWPEVGEEETFQYSYLTQYDAFPILGGAYIQDKIEYEGMFANIGLRFDYSDPNTLWPSRDNPFSSFYTAGMKDLLFEQDSLLEDVPAHLKLSPRVGISFPILEKSKLFFNYGHFYSLAPNKNRFLIGWGRPSQPIKYMGNPYIDMARTISYEVGFESNIANQFLARVTGYYKDMDNEFGEVGYALEQGDPSFGYTTYENLKYGDTRGFELELRKQQGRFFTGWVIYDYRVTSSGLFGKEDHFNTPADELTTGFNDPEQTEPVPQPVWRAQATFKTPLDWGIFLGGYNLSLVYSWRAGRYETWNPFPGQIGLVQYQVQNNLQWESERNLDLSLSKNISVAGTALTLFMDVHNVFDWQELSSQAFDGDQGNYIRSLHLEMFGEEPYASAGIGTPPADGEEPDRLGIDFRSDEKPYINNPNRDFMMYLDPRYVQFGVRFSF
ncbi:carboxypeptidase regulatory-like domain-containing protein [candidate division WOR-3 bacterium]|nr:carboxypeptidase regulatory-like domain-containing protein [candidate division WOR-3 bacterium]